MITQTLSKHCFIFATMSMTVRFPNVKVWTRDMFPMLDSYDVMQKVNGLRKHVTGTDYVFDCEYINGINIILDCYKVFNKVIDTQPFRKRLELAKAYLRRSRLGGFKVIDVLDISGPKQLFDELYKTDSNDLIDGLILRNKYDSFQKSKVFKLKTAKMSTVDFYLKDGQLFAWGTNDELVPFEFPLLDNSGIYSNVPLCPDQYTAQEIADIEILKQQDLDGKVIEFTWDGYNWQPLKIRTDKQRPNRLEFALANTENVYYPLRFENMFPSFEHIYINRKTKVITDSPGKGYEIMPDGFDTNGYTVNGQKDLHLAIYRMRLQK